MKAKFTDLLTIQPDKKLNKVEMYTKYPNEEIKTKFDTYVNHRKFALGLSDDEILKIIEWSELPASETAIFDWDNTINIFSDFFLPKNDEQWPDKLY